MRFLMAIALLTVAFAGCVSEDAASANALPAELSVLGLTDVTDQVATWAYAILDATESGDVTGVTFVITDDILAQAEARGGDLIMQVTPALPVDAELSKYAVLVFDTGRNVQAEAQAAADTANGAAADAQADADAAQADAQAQAEAVAATLTSVNLFTELETVTQTAAGAQSSVQATGAGPLTVDLGSAADFEAGDVIGIVLGAQTIVDAAKGQVDAAAADAQADADAAQADAQAQIDSARADVTGKMALFVSFVEEAQAAAPSEADVQAILDDLAAQGQGQAMEIVGQAEGLLIPAFSMDLDGQAGVRTITQSADIDAALSTATGGPLPLPFLLNTETFELSLVTDAIGGFGLYEGAISGNFGSMDWVFDADVHGVVAQAQEAGLNAGPASDVGGAFEVVGSGSGPTEILFEAQMQGRDLAGNMFLGGFELGAPLEDLLGQPIDPVSQAAGNGLPFP